MKHSSFNRAPAVLMRSDLALTVLQMLSKPSPPPPPPPPVQASRSSLSW